MYADANILFDEGAQRSFITEKLADTLQLQRHGHDVIHLASFGESTQHVRHMDVATVFLVTDAGQKISIQVLVVPTIAVPLRNMQRSVTSLPYLKGLKLAHPLTECEKFEISLLIGADSFWKVVENRTVRGNGPTAVKSKIGYLLSGPLPVTSQNNSTSHIFNVISSPPDGHDLERFWKLESMGISSDEKDSDSTEYQDNCIEFKNGRYTAKLPWKQEHSPLPTNYNITKQRTESTIRRLRQEPHILKKYGEIIAEQEKRGFIEKVIDTSMSNSLIHYIPHHGIRKDSKTTPINIVYDCSCRQSRDQPSLNDCLESTPPILNNLSSILIRFRMHKYAVSTDIEKAFLHVRLDEADRDVTRFLWLSDTNDLNSPLTTYSFKSVLFGATCSSVILNATLLKHFEENKTKWVSEILKRDLYVDNILSSFQEESDVLSYFRDTRTIMSEAGFNLRSWTSNSPHLRHVGASECVLDTDTITKVLGMRWNIDTDELLFQNRTISTSDCVTKREILQQTSAIYDPLGLLCPVTIRAKTLLQELWQQKYDWDTPLPSDFQRKWAAVVSDLNIVMNTKFPRHCLVDTLPRNTTVVGKSDLHIFVDASMLSYGATAYLCQGNIGYG